MDEFAVFFGWDKNTPLSRFQKHYHRSDFWNHREESLQRDFENYLTGRKNQCWHGLWNDIDLVHQGFREWESGDYEDNPKRGICQKANEPKSGKDISYHDALTLSPSLICQKGLEEAIEYCELDSEAKKRIAEDFKAVGLIVKKGCITKDVTALLTDHIQDIIRRKKGLLRGS